MTAPQTPSSPSIRGRAAMRRRLRRLAAVALPSVVLLGALTASTASAAPPLRLTAQSVVVPECLADSEGVQAVLYARWADTAAPDASLLLTRDGELLAYDSPDHRFPVTWDGSVLSGAVVLVGVGAGEDPGGVVGEATFEVTLAAEGAPSAEPGRQRDGNVTLREVVTRQPMRVTEGTVSATVDGRTLRFDLAGCAGVAGTAELFLTQPDTWVDRLLPAVNAECTATNAAGEQLLLLLSSHHGAVEVLVAASGAAGSVFGLDEWEWSGPPQPLQGTVEMFRLDPDGGAGGPVGAAVVDLASQKTGQTRTTLVFQGGRDRISTTFFRLDGTLTVDGFAPFPLSGCEGTIQTALNRHGSPSGPPAAGPAPRNDAPEAAADLGLDGRQVNLQTGGAQPEPEAEMSCVEREFLPGHTVWYRFTGTGGPVTIDPAGSSFNTVLAAYVEQQGELAEVEGGCVDDAGFGTLEPTTLAPLTLDTVKGASYYVQAGGFGAQHGRLRLSAIVD